MTDKLCFVHFPHPGGEHGPDRDGWKAWNTARHARKFLQSFGRWRTSGNLGITEHGGDVLFWGEWEPPSRVKPTHTVRNKSWPKYIHVPFWQPAPDFGFFQNTDPYVFGNHFLYSNCRQNNKNGPLATQRLATGSLVAFGSGLAGKFVIDTVFVVLDAQPISVAAVDGLTGIDDVFKAVVLDLMCRDYAHRRYRLYRGATPATSVDGMFSFFPCLPLAEAPAGFPRPSVRLDGFINAKNWRSFKITECESRNDVSRLWHSIVRQILDQGLNLGVHAATPAKISGSLPGPESEPSTDGCGASS